MNSYHFSPPPPRRPQPPPTIQLRQNPEKMSITQTFYLAHKARAKLSSEASRQDHNLRLLVGHANLLDTLMIHLTDAERDEERWFNNMVRGNEELRESREFPETIEEESEESEEYGSLAADYDTESDTSSESDEGEMEDVDFGYPLLARESSFMYPSTTTRTLISVSELDGDYEDADDDTEEEDEDGMYSLTRTTSRRPPSLCSDYSDEEEEESNPPSPPQPTIPHPPLSHKQQAYLVGQHGSAQPASLFDGVPGYFEPQQSPPPIISTF
jgi:hypothetical protein